MLFRFVWNILCVGLAIGSQLQYWLSHYINNKWSINIDILKTVTLCRHWHLFVHCITGIAYPRHNLQIMCQFLLKFSQWYSTGCFENLWKRYINIELSHINKIFCCTNRQIYRYTIYCAIPNQDPLRCYLFTCVDKYFRPCKTTQAISGHNITDK